LEIREAVFVARLNCGEEGGSRRTERGVVFAAVFSVVVVVELML